MSKQPRESGKNAGGHNDPVNVLRLEVHKQTALRVNMLMELSHQHWKKVCLHLTVMRTHTRTHTHSHKRKLVDSPVFGDVCSVVLIIVGSSRGSGPERDGTPSKRRVY